MAKQTCPLCSGRAFSIVDGFLVCARCSELLKPSELVRRATRRTKRRYCLANFGTTTYPGE